VLHRCAESLSGRLDEAREYCRTLALLIGMAEGACLQETERLALPTNDSKTLYSAALRLLGRVRLERPPISVRLKACELGAGSALPLVLFDDNQHGRGLPHERRARLETTLAYLRRRYGASAVLRAGVIAEAQRIRLWTYPLGHLLDEEIRVATDGEGVPVRYWRYRRHWQRWDVKSIHDRWRETEWLGGRLSERTVYRLETEPAGICELHQMEAGWRLAAMAD
jgi:hypothetical protein